jgi:hypothetical protein
MFNSKEQTCLSDKMPSQKVKIKNPFSNFAKAIFSFPNVHFLGEKFVTKVSLHFEISIKFSFVLYPI